MSKLKKSEIEYFRREFENKQDLFKREPRVYKKLQYRGLLNVIFGEYEAKPFGYWTLETIQVEALKYNTRGEFMKGSCGVYSKAHRLGILDEVCAHMEKQYEDWTPETMQAEALKYNTRGEFQKGNASAYGTAHTRGIIDVVCSHMEPSKTGSLELEYIKQEALKYNTRSEFMKGHAGAYQAAHKRGIIDEVCVHMEPSKSAPISIRCTETGEVFASQSEAARKMNLRQGSINAVLKGKRKSTGGYSFEYVEESDNTEE